MKITNLFRMSSDKGRACAFTGHRPQNYHSVLMRMMIGALR